MKSLNIDLWGVTISKPIKGVEAMTFVFTSEEEAGSFQGLLRTEFERDSVMGRLGNPTDVMESIGEPRGAGRAQPTG